MRTDRRPFPLLFCLSLFLLPGVAAAYQPLITDDTGTQGAGNQQIELSLDGSRARQAGHTDSARGGSFVYTYGATETLDLFAGVAYVDIRRDSPEGPSRGFGSPALGVKWRLYDNDALGTSFALKPELRLPTSAQNESQGLGVGRLSGRLTAILTQNVPFGAVHLNAVAGRERSRDPSALPESTYRRVSVAPAWHMSDAWKLVADLGLEWSRASQSARTSRYVEAGVVCTQSKSVDLALGLIGARDDAQPSRDSRAATLGLTVHF